MLRVDQTTIVTITPKTVTREFGDCSASYKEVATLVAANDGYVQVSYDIDKSFSARKTT